MQKTGEMANGKQNPPVMIALLDGVGITHELNGYRNDATGWIDKHIQPGKPQQNAYVERYN